MSTEHEMRAYLGEVETTDDQFDLICRAADAINARFPEPDLADLREAALSHAVLVVLGEDDVESVASQWHAARRLERERHAAMTGAVIATILGGESENGLSIRTGVTRVTIRKALGR